MQPNTVQWIREQLSAGYSVQTVRNQLIATGYNPGDVENALRAAGARVDTRKSKGLSKQAMLLLFIMGLGIVLVGGSLFVFLNDDKPVKIVEPPKPPIKEQPKETCFDGIKNQNEEEVDCGGSCNECNKNDDSDKCPSSCNDGNSCTKDFCGISTSYECINELTVPCCGNGNCEPGENYDSCSTDCEKIDIPTPDEEIDKWETLELVKELSKTDDRGAVMYCEKLEGKFWDKCLQAVGENALQERYCEKPKDEKLRDECFKNVAKFSNNTKLCERVSQDNRKDTCYMNFVTGNKDYSVCNKLVNEYLKQSCDALRQLNEQDG